MADLLRRRPRVIVQGGSHDGRHSPVRRHRPVSDAAEGCAEAFAPAVSAPSADGFTSRQAVEAAFLAGKNEEFWLFEVMELNPIYDRDHQTARLAATIITAFLTGLTAASADRGAARR